MVFLSRSPTGTRSSLRSPLTAVLLSTVGLSLWLGWQAYDAERHHRKAVTATLREYTGMAAWELARLAREGLDWYVHEVFDDLDRSRRGVEPEAITWAMAAAARRHGCDCPALRTPLGQFRIDYPEGRLTIQPDTFSAAFGRELITTLSARQSVDGERRRGFVYRSDATLPGGGLVTAYALRYDRADELTTAYGFLATGTALGEIVGHWYENNALLPPTMERAESNDSLLQVRVVGPNGVELFSTFDVASEDAGPTELASQLAYGDLSVDVDVRPRAAEQLVIGGLPPPRTGLFFGLIALVLAVGTFGLFQIRRERELADLRDDFLSGVSHELRTPLAQIRMFAELLTTSRLRSDADRERASQVIDREARRLTHLVESVLQFNRLRRSRDEPVATATLSLSEAVADAVDAFGPLAAARGTTFDMELDEALQVEAERPGLRQIIVNLLDNALKYGPSGQVVRVRAVREGTQARISVEDQGPGVPVTEREHVFAPYVRLTRDRRAPEPGTGIGLAVVASLVTRYGGRCTVDDAPEGRARFTVLLPAVEGPPAAASARLVS